MNQPLLFDLFDEIRKDKLFGNPGLEEYYLVFELIRKKYRITDFDELKFVLEAIWLKNHAQKERFSSLLDARKNSLLEFVKSLEQAKQQRQPGVTAPVDPLNVAPAGGGSERPATRPGQSTPSTRIPDTPAPITPDLDIKTSFSMGTARENSRTLSISAQSSKIKNTLEIPFLFTNDYFPVKRRHLQQTWRGLKNKLDAGETSELDLQNTIRHIANQGYFSDLIFYRRNINEVELFILLDKSESMMAELEFGKEICTAASLSNVHTQVEPWYFYEVPQMNGDGEYTLFNEDNTRSIAIKKLLTTRNKKNRFILKKNVVVLVYSDCGSLAKNFDEKKTKAIEEFISFLYQNTAYIAWLNPAPRERWKWTNSERLSNLVPMFETTRTDTENAIAALKGRIHIISQ
jgi:hypothetical protein